MQKKDKTGSEALPYRIGVFPVPGFALMSYACTVEPLRAANLLSKQPLYEIVHFGEGRVQCSGAAEIEPRFAVGDQVDLDMLLVVAGGDPFAFEESRTLAWLRQVAKSGVHVGGVSGGSVILARAGLMTGRRMTVHWEHAPALAERFPDILIERRLYVMDRDRVTCGGGTAPLDMMHALISDQHGAVFAHLVSDWFLHTDIRAAAAPQKTGLVERTGVRSPHVLAAVSAMEDHIADPLSLPQLAMVAGVTTRHLNRLFGDALGESAMGYYRNLRLDLGRRLVNASSMSIAEISEATGFSSFAHFSNAYVQRYNIRPMADRRAVATQSA